MDRAALDEAIARLLADALVRELRQELTVQNEAPGAGNSDAGAGCANEARTREITPLPRKIAS